MIIKNVKTILFASLIVAMILPFSMGNHVIAETFDGQIDTSSGYTINANSAGEDKLSVGTGKEITTNYTVLDRAHSDVTGIMIEQSEKVLEIYDGPDIPIVMAYIDDDTLVIGLDPMAMYFDPPIEPELLQHILDIDEPVEIQYVSFEDEASASQTKSWQDKYKKSCMPVKSGYQNVCKAYKNIMSRLNIPLPTGTTSSTTTSTTTSTQTNNGSPCDTSARSTACYYYKQYEQKCTNGKTYKRCGTYATQIKSAGYSLPVSSGTQTVTPTVTTPTYELNNVQAAKSGDNITLSWDAPTGFKVKYYKIYVTDNDRYYKYKGKINKSATSYTLSDVTEGKSYKFKIKLYYENQHGSTSVKYFYSNSVDVPRTIIVDRISPVITVPQDITKRALTSSGVTINYVVSAIDETDGRVAVQCSQASGTNFGIGKTMVSCSATDKAGNKSTVSFNILVDLLKAIGVSPVQKEFYGGNEYHLFVENATNKYTKPSTITIGATNSTGSNGIVVSGHGIIVPDGFTFVDHRIGIEEISITTESVLVHYNGNVDAAFIPITEPNIIVGSKVQTSSGDIIPISQGTLESVPRGEDLSIYGNQTNGSGDLFVKNATIFDSRHVLSNMGVALYPSVRGDSGAPIVYHKDGNANLVGVHHGGVCLFEAASESQPRIDVRLNPSLCTKDNYYYKTFSAWENVKNRLNLQ